MRQSAPVVVGQFAKSDKRYGNQVSNDLCYYQVQLRDLVYSHTRDACKFSNFLAQAAR